jgi:aquaporin Z
VEFGATATGAGDSAGLALAGEAVTTFALVAGLFFFLRHDRLRRFTPALFPVLYAIMVYLEAPLSGTSTNPARSLGPAVISGEWHAWWIYWVGPILGAVAGVLFYRFSWLRSTEIRIAKLYHFGHDRYGVFQHQEKPVVGS